MTTKSIFEAALSMKTKDRELLLEELARSLYDEDSLVEGANLAFERITRSDRDPSRRVSKDQILKILEIEGK